MSKLTLKLLLSETGIPLEHIRLLRHKATAQEATAQGRTPYLLWRDDRESFYFYQSFQRNTNRTKLDFPYWASFLGMPDGRTLFVGLFEVKRKGQANESMIHPITKKHLLHDDDLYELTLDERLSEYIGRLIIEWGDAPRAWVQRADTQDKDIIALHEEFKDEDFLRN
jgi:hypothetical protein